MKSSKLTATRFLFPWIVGLVWWTIMPLASVLLLSFTRSSGSLTNSEFQWIGLENYRQCLTLDAGGQSTHRPSPTFRLTNRSPRDPLFFTALFNTLAYALMAVPLEVGFALAAALWVNRRGRARTFIQTVLCLPHILAGVSAALVWSWLLNPRFGLVNRFIRVLYAGMDPMIRVFGAHGTDHWTTPDWLYSPVWCKPALVLINLWTIGGAMLVFLAALSRVPREWNESALIDGATGWRRFRHITWPALTPAVVFNLVISWVFAMRTFTEPYLLRNRRQEDGLLFFVVYLYQAAFEPPYRMGYAAAMSCVFFVVLSLTVGLIWLTSRRWVFEAYAR